VGTARSLAQQGIGAYWARAEVNAVVFVRIQSPFLQRGWTGTDEDLMSEVRPDLTRALDEARAGEACGFDALFRATGPAVAGYLRARGVSDPDGAANDVFLRAFKTIHTFQGDGERFRAWLFTIAHNAAIDDNRRRKRRVKETPLDRAPDTAGGDVEDDLLTRLAEDRVRALLDHLSPDQREALMLRVVADLSVEETAAVMGKGYEAVKALQRRGLATLRRQLSEGEGVPR
jgi:RNA polymerase sigma-70 factor (ECF subfamily)